MRVFECQTRMRKETEFVGWQLGLFCDDPMCLHHGPVLDLSWIALEHKC